MDLRTYLESRNMTLKEFSAMIKINEGAMNHYIHGRRKFPLKVAYDVINATSGRVTLEDLLLMQEKK